MFEAHLPNIITAVTALAAVAVGYGALQQRVKDIEVQWNRLVSSDDECRRRLTRIERYLAFIAGKLGHEPMED